MRKLHRLCLALFMLSIVEGFSDETISVTSANNQVKARLTPDGKIMNLSIGNQTFLFRQDAYHGPTWIVNNKSVSLSPVGDGKATFKGNSDGLALGLEFVPDMDRLTLRCTITNHGSKPRQNLSAGIVLGIDTYMDRYPDWNDRLFPTLVRCEKTHLWGYAMSPLGKILGISSPQPIASYHLKYESNGHRIFTIVLDLLHPGKQPSRHPQALHTLAAGESKRWDIILQSFESLDQIKPKQALSTGAAMFDIERYTIGDGEAIDGKIFSSSLKSLVLTSPDGKKNAPEFKKKEEGLYQFTTPLLNGKGIYTLTAITDTGKISEAKVSLRHAWSWYLKKARENAISKPQKASIVVESWYGFYSMYLAQKHFPDPLLDKQAEEKYREIFALLFKDMGNTMTIYGNNRPQNHTATAGMEVDCLENLRHLLPISSYR